MPLISVIVPVYNVETVLPRCIDSILGQSFRKFELILVDDGGQDRSGEICDKYAQKDSRIRVIHQKNAGVSAARNAGINASTGQYIAFIDSDDYISDDYLQTLYDCHCDLPICGLDILDQNGVQLQAIRYDPVSYAEQCLIDYAGLYKKNMLYSPYCKLFRGDIVRDRGMCFPQGITWGEDGMFVANYLPYISSMEVLSYSGYRYIKYDSQSSLSCKVRPDIIDMITISREYCIEKIREFAPDAYGKVRQACTEDICNNCAYFVTQLLESKIDMQETIEMLSRFLENKYVQKAISESPKYFYGDNYVNGDSVGPDDAERIYRKFKLFRYRELLMKKLYPLYDSMPDGIKAFYRIIKQKVKK